MTDVDAIRWIHMTDDEVVRLRAAVGKALVAFPDVIAAYHYGSSARRQPARDIDIGLVATHEARATIDIDAVAACIAQQAGRSGDEFDVRVVNDADSVFLGNLMREGKLCFERDRDQRVAFEVKAMNSWLDFQPAWDRLRRSVLERWSRG